MAFEHIGGFQHGRGKQVEHIGCGAIQNHFHKHQQAATEPLWIQRGAIAGQIAVPKQAFYPFGGGGRGQADPFGKLDDALSKRGNDGPFFNGKDFSLVDCAYAPFLQRYYFLDRIRPIGLIGKYPRLKAWADTLIKRPSTHSFPEAEFEALYRANVKRRNKWISQFIAEQAVAADDPAQVSGATNRFFVAGSNGAIVNGNRVFLYADAALNQTPCDEAAVGELAGAVQLASRF